MTRLVWMEFINTVYGKSKTQLGTSIASLFKTMLFLWVFVVAAGDATANGMMFILLMSIGSYLDSSVGDVMYMIPGTLEKYLYAKLKVVLVLQFGVLAGIELVRVGLHLTGARSWLIYEEVVAFLGYCVFIVLRSVWKFYQKYTFRQFYQEKAAGITAFIGIFLTVGISASPEESDIVIETVRWCAFLVYLGYTIYICRFVKKNIMLTTYFGGTE